MDTSQEGHFACVGTICADRINDACNDDFAYLDDEEQHMHAAAINEMLSFLAACLVMHVTAPTSSQPTPASDTDPTKERVRQEENLGSIQHVLVDSCLNDALNDDFAGDDGWLADRQQASKQNNNEASAPHDST